MSRKKKIKEPPHWLYFLIQDGKVVYIGVTKNLFNRMISHKNKKHNSVRVWKFESKYLAMYYERRWIIVFWPVYNKQNIRTGNIMPINVPVTFMTTRANQKFIKDSAKQKGMSISEFILSNLHIDVSMKVA